MSRGRILVGVAVLGAFAAGVGTGWFLAVRHPAGQPANPAAPGHAVAPPMPNDLPGQPTRPPELFGRVEAVRHSERDGTAFLVRSTKPNLAGWDSEQNSHHRNIDMPCWVGVREGIPIRQRSGGVGEAAVGQTVSVWCSGPMATTYPPGWVGDFAVIEPDDR